LKKPSACLCPWMDFQYSCFLLVQPLISPMATYTDMGTAGLGTLMDMRSVIKHNVGDSQNTTKYLFAKCWCTR
jgi:hypothetical protein